MDLEANLNKESPKRNLGFGSTTPDEYRVVGLTSNQKKQAEKSEKSDHVRADLMFFNETSKERRKIYDEIGVDEKGIKSIEDSLKSLVEHGNVPTLPDDGTIDVEMFNYAIDRVSLEVLGKGNWPVPSIQDYFDKNTFAEISRFEVITHPLFYLLSDDGWNEDLWVSSGEDIDKYMEKQLLPVANKIIERLESNPDYASSAYFYLMDAVQEVKDMQIQPSRDVLRIYNMPRRSFLPEPKIKAMDALLKKFSGPNVVVIDSYDDGTGKLKDSDVDFFAKNLPQNATIELQGGYLTACLEANYDSFNDDVKKTRPDLNLLFDFDSSTSFGAHDFDDVKSNHNYDFLQGLPRIKLPSSGLKSVGDLVNWIESNTEVNAFYSRKAGQMHSLHIVSKGARPE